MSSTQDEALAWARTGAPEGAVVVAEEQRAGRGRAGRRWLSPPGRSLYLSVVLRPAPNTLPGLVTTAVGLAVAEAIEGLYALPTGLKWPNDVTVAGRKVAGVLVESVLSGSEVLAAAAGVGINVAWAPEELPADLSGRATSVLAELERGGRRLDHDRVDLLGALFRTLPPALGLAYEGRGAELVERAAARSVVLGRRVSVRLAAGGTCEGVALRLLPTGALEVGSAGGTRSLDAGEIERLLPA